MSHTVHTHAGRPDLARRAAAAEREIWPEYNRHGDVTSASWRRMNETFPELQFVVHDDDTDTVVAEGHTMAICWDGTVADLPHGIDGVYERGFGMEPKTALCAMAAEIWPAHRGTGMAAELLRLMAEVARREGCRDLLAAVRPSWKERYPLAPIEDYARWTRDDGLPFDPWLRTHVRIGGQLLHPEPRSLRITGTVAEWEEWTGMAFPVDGDYVFPHGLALLHVERAGDVGLYHEPNVWVRHRL